MQCPTDGTTLTMSERSGIEIDGIHHSWAQNIVGDALRQNALTLQGDRVLRLPLLGLRLRADEFFAQIEQALMANGYRAAA